MPNRNAHEPKIYILHENDEWSAPLDKALAALGVPYEMWFLNEGVLNLAESPPPGIFYNRMSASSHTRDHRYAAEYTGCVLDWLEAHDRTVLNGSHALKLEVSKVAQYAALQAHGIKTPHTVAAIGQQEILKAARYMSGAFITKHNRGGKGLGVHLFDNVSTLEEYLQSDAYEVPIDGVTLVQAYIDAPERFITRCEFVGQEFLYALRVDTTDGFELCPADACPLAGPHGSADLSGSGPRFDIVQGFESPLVEQYQRFMRRQGVHIAGIEFIADANGVAYTYDINTNTNYNPDAEARAGAGGMRAIARYLSDTLSATYRNHGTWLKKAG